MSKLTSLLSLSLLIFTGCTGRSSQSSSTPVPVQQQPQTQPDQTQATQNTTGQQPQTEPQVNGDTSDDVIPMGTNSNETPPDVTESNSDVSTTPTATTTPTTPTPDPTPPASNPTGTIDIQGSTIQFQDLKLTVPAGWKLHQDALNDGTLIIAFEKDSEYFRLYARQGAAATLQSIFVNGSQVVKAEREETIGSRSWKRIETQKNAVSVAGFQTTYNGHTYFGFGRAGSVDAASAAATLFLGTIK